jgi:hypothetical protein
MLKKLKKLKNYWIRRQIRLEEEADLRLKMRDLSWFDRRKELKNNRLAADILSCK